MSQILKLNLNWFEKSGWVCPFCGGEIDHLQDEEDEESMWTDESYKCVEENGPMCPQAYMMRRFSNVLDGDNGDSRTISHWIEIQVEDRLTTDPDADAFEAHEGVTVPDDDEDEYEDDEDDN